MLPFSREAFMAVFNTYNGHVWPAQAVAYLLGFAVLAVLWKPSESAGRFVAAVLGTMWLWTGIAYHALHFSAINRAAWAFGALFVAQGVALLWAGTVRGRLAFGRCDAAAAWVGASLMAYAIALYPLIGLATGHSRSELPMFGITPCPLTIFTLGVLLWMARVPWWLLVVPIVWSLIGGSAAFLLRVPQDWLLLFSGIATASLLIRGRHRRAAAVAIAANATEHQPAAASSSAAVR